MRKYIRNNKINNSIYTIAFIVFIKLVLMGLFSSDFQNEMFKPFTSFFVENLLQLKIVNPYELLKQQANLFPYPPMMLFIESIGALLSKLSGDSVFFQNFLFKIPLLVFDILGLYFLFSVCKNRKSDAIIYYFLSPIILYASFMHGQLDIIPTVFLFGAICYLTVLDKKSDIKFMLMLFLALSCKLHILAITPVLFMYIYKRDGFKKALYLISVPLALTVLLILPFWGHGMLKNVLLNDEQSLMTTFYFSYGYVKIYIPILVFMIVYFKILTIHRINKDLLYSLSGLIFTLFLALVPPMPGWYIWIIPYLSIFFINLSIKKSWAKLVIVSLNLVYLLYFILIHNTGYVDLYFINNSLDVIKINDEVISNMVFTLLTSILIFATYLMYKFGITSNSLYKSNHSFMIGLSGDSGSGKTSLLNMMYTVIGEKNLLVIEGDGDHKWERGDDMWDHYTHLNPKANEIYKQANDITDLRYGKPVVRNIYNHDTGTFDNSNVFEPKRFVVLAGLHSLYLPQIRNNLDLKVFLDLDENLRKLWKIRRDTSKRGYEVDKVIKSIEDRLEDSEKYIIPQKRHADIILRIFDEELIDYTDLDYQEKLSLKVSIVSSENLEKLINRVEALGINVRFDFEKKSDKMTIIFSGENLNNKDIDIVLSSSDIIPHIDDIVSIKPNDENNLDNIILLLLLITIDYKMRRGE